jgi:hypothetical protein
LVTLLGGAEIRDLADRLNVNPTKKLGQNFVTDPNTIRRIVQAAKLSTDEIVVEIGPGLGSLTLGLLEVAAAVVAVAPAGIGTAVPAAVGAWVAAGAARGRGAGRRWPSLARFLAVRARGQVCRCSRRARTDCLLGVRAPPCATSVVPNANTNSARSLMSAIK